MWHVQGPAPTNQRVLATAHVCDPMVSIFEFILSLQLEGKLHKVATYYSLLTTYYSLLATYHLLLTT